MHIGNRIREVVKEQGRSHSWLARQLNTVRPNIYNIYRRKSLDTELLTDVSIVLGHNFVAELASEVARQIKEIE